MLVMSDMTALTSACPTFRLCNPMQKSGQNLQFAGSGMELLGYLLVFGGGGYLLDRWLETSPAFLLVGVTLGIVGGLTKVILDALRANRQQN